METNIETEKTKWVNKKINNTSKNVKIKKNKTKPTTNEPFHLQQPALEPIFILPSKSSNMNTTEENKTLSDKDKKKEKNASENNPIIKEGFDTTTITTTVNQMKRIWLQSIKNIDISNIFERINRFIIGTFISLFTFREIDYLLVKKNFENMLLLFISFYITYNLFFVMFFKDFSNRVEIPQLTTEKLKNFNYIVYFFFRPHVAVTEFLQNMFVKRIPFVFENSLKAFETVNVISSAISVRICFVFVFLLSILFSFNYIAPLYNSLINAINMRTDVFSGIIFAFKIIYIFLATIYDQLPHLSDGFGIFRKILFATSIINIIVVIITLIIVIMFSHYTAFITTTLLCSIAFITTLFSIPLFSQYGMKNTFIKIQEYAYYGNMDDNNNNDAFKEQMNQTDNCDKYIKDTSCDMPKTFLQKCIQRIIWIMDRSYKYIFELSIVFLFFTQLIEYSIKIKNIHLKMTLILFCITVILIVFAKMFFS